MGNVRLKGKGKMWTRLLTCYLMAAVLISCGQKSGTEDVREDDVGEENPDVVSDADDVFDVPTDFISEDSVEDDGGPPPDTSTWVRFYIQEDMGTGNAPQAIPTSDGGYLAATSAFPAGGDNLEFLVIKIDADGAVDWAKAYSSEFWDRAYAAVEATDGGYIVAGTSEHDSTFFGEIWLFRLDEDGALVWQKRINDATATDMINAGDDRYLIAGATGPGDLLLLMLNGDGFIEWQQVYRYDVSDFIWDSIASDVIQTSDGGFLVTSKLNYGYDPAEDSWVVKTDSTGNPVWQKEVRSVDDRYLINGVFDLASGGYVLVGRVDTATLTRDGWVVRLDADGNVVWQNAIGDGEVEEFYSGDEHDSGRLLVFGSTGIDAELDHADALVVFLDTGGRAVRQLAYGGTEAEVASKGYSLGSSGILFVASARESYVSEDCSLMMVKTDTEGGVSTYCPAEFTTTMSLSTVATTATFSDTSSTPTAGSLASVDHIVDAPAYTPTLSTLCESD
jgi:hypothetical protein